MNTIRRVGVALACMTALSTYVAAQDPLSQAKGLYDSASYSEALSALSQVPSGGDVVEVEKYRALCLLALNRPKDAEQSLEHLAMTRPLFTLEGSDASPKLVAMFADVRRRTLPEASKQTFQRARASFESGDMAEASRQFKDVLAMTDAAAPESAVLMNDLRMLAAGFVKLTEAALTPKPEVRAAPAATAAIPPPTAAAPPVAATTASANTSVVPRAERTTSAAAATTPNVTTPNPTLSNPATSQPVAEPAPRPAVLALAARARNSTAADPVYQASDTTVQAAVAISRPLPKWERPSALKVGSFQGLLEIIVAEDGSVIDATMLKLMHPTYDRLLTSAAKNWRFQPATLEGRPVKYRLTYSFAIQ